MTREALAASYLLAALLGQMSVAANDNDSPVIVTQGRLSHPSTTQKSHDSSVVRGGPRGTSSCKLLEC
jgi:hypothetical protein